MLQFQPFEGGHDVDVVHSENEFDTLTQGWPVCVCGGGN